MPVTLNHADTAPASSPTHAGESGMTVRQEMTRPTRRRAFALVTALLIAASPAINRPVLAADEKTNTEGRDDMATRVIELFTSHGCSSCPPADAFLGQLLNESPELVAIEFHVDYWNSLVHGSAGSWQDPFSDSAWSLRQRAYDGRPLAGRPGIYTPQVIINGGYAAVGSDRRRIRKALATDAPAAPSIRLERTGGEFAVSVTGVRFGERTSRTRDHLPAPTPDTGEVALVRFLNRTTTAIEGGENKGREIVNHRVVTSMESLGHVDDAGALSTRVSAPTGKNEGCAILVRHGDEMAILAGTLCPSPA